MAFVRRRQSHVQPDAALLSCANAFLTLRYVWTDDIDIDIGSDRGVCGDGDGDGVDEWDEREEWRNAQ